MAGFGIHSSMALQPFVRIWPVFQFRNLSYTDGGALWTSDQPVTRPLPTHRTTQTQNKPTQTSISRVGFEPTIPEFEQPMTVHALDRAAGFAISVVESSGSATREIVGFFSQNYR
jgi:hypothetical protein